jgi:DNA-binding response OmpR family regulator
MSDMSRKSKAVILAVDDAATVLLVIERALQRRGFEVLSAATAGIPIIFLTGKSSTEDVVHGFRLGGVDYIVKPFHPEELIARVETHVQLHQLRSILPICSYCGKIRNEKEDWEALDSYVHRHAGTAFSHSICPGCYAVVRSQLRPRSGSDPA